MHLLFCGMKHSADTAPIVGEILNDRDLVFICSWLISPYYQTWYISREPVRYISWYPFMISLILFISSVFSLNFSQLFSYAVRFSNLLTIITLLYWPVISVMM